MCFLSTILVPEIGVVDCELDVLLSEFVNVNGGLVAIWHVVLFSKLKCLLKWLLFFYYYSRC